MVNLGPGPDPKWASKIKPADEITANYFVQYLTPAERKKFVNAAYKALKKGGKLVIIVPHWCAQKAYQDVDVQWPPVSEGWFSMLNKRIRDAQPFQIKGYTCDFEYAVGYGMHPSVVTRNQEFQQFALGYYREAAQDIHVTLTKR